MESLPVIITLRSRQALDGETSRLEEQAEGTLAAAAEGCRLLATSSDTAAGGLCEEYIRRRLGAVPPHECFHVHEGGCSWEITFTGNESSSEVGVTIATAVRPLPLIDFMGRAMGFTDDAGNLRVEVSASMPTQPSWAIAAAEGQPSSWPGAWLQ